MSLTKRTLGFLLATAILLTVNSCGDDDSPTDTVIHEPGIVWTARSTGTSSFMIDVTWSETHGMFVAVGNNGVIMTSSYGLVWTQQESPTDEYLLEVTATASEFIAVGDNGTVLTSPDGVTWTLVSLDSVGVSAGWLYGGIASSGSVVVAVGQDGAIIHADGDNWQLADSSRTTQDLFGVTWSEQHSIFVAVGGLGTIMTSSDGNVWTLDTLSPTTAWLYDVTWSDAAEMFVAVGQNGTILTSSDAEEWSEEESRLGAYLYAVTWSDGLFVVVGQNGLILSSADSEVWTLREHGLADNLRSVTWSSVHNRFVAVGLSQTVLVSDDGLEWNAQVTGGDFDLYDVTCVIDDDTLCLAVGSGGTILASSDGVDWSLRRSGGTDVLRSITHRGGANEFFVAVGDNGRILLSSDAVTWDSSTATVHHLHDVAASSQLLVAVGRSGTILTSEDGATWTRVPNLGTSEHFHSVAWSGSAFVTVGDSGIVAIAQGDQAPPWDTLRILTEPFLQDVFWNDTIFVAVGEQGVIFTSPNGRNWTEQLWDVLPEQLKGLNAVGSSGSLYVAVGINLTIISSGDATEWIGRGQGASGSLEGVTWTGTRFVAVGWDNIIVTSP